MSALSSLSAAIRAAGVDIVGVSDGTPIRIDYRGTPTQAQITTAEGVRDAFDLSAAAEATRVAKAAKAAATASVDNGAAQNGVPVERLVRSLLPMILDEFNLHTTFEAALLAAIAAATSLANLQTRVAAITPVPQRTEAQLVTALKNKIAATAE